MTLVALAGASVAVLAGLGRGEAPRFLTEAPSGVAAAGRPRPRGPRILHLAGSGTNVPLTRILARAFAQAHTAGPVRVVVHESIGSGGGIQAVRDGVIDLGLVSRPLKPSERKAGVEVLPYARVAVVVAARPDIGAVELRGDALLALYRGDRARWSDGRAVSVILRESGDSSHQAVNRVLPGFAAVCARARQRGRWRVVYTDSAMHDALLSVPGAVGLFDFGSIVTQRLPLQVLPYAGLKPSARDPLPAGYPFSKVLAFASRGRPRGLAAAFVSWVRSPQGAVEIRRQGYLPLGTRPRGGSAP